MAGLTFVKFLLYLTHHDEKVLQRFRPLQSLFILIRAAVAFDSEIQKYFYRADSVF